MTAAFKFPDSILANHVAVLGKTGSGKTSTAKLAIEQVAGSGARVCILDPIKSDWWGLTSSADGKRPGLPFHILGGPRGHVPLHESAGKAIGEVVASGALPLSIVDMAPASGPLTKLAVAGMNGDKRAVAAVGRMVRDSGDAALSSGERKILTAIAQHPGGVTRSQLSVLADYKRSSRDAYLQRLSGKGFVGSEGGCIAITADGVAALGDFEPLPTGSALADYWLANLPEGEARILQVLIDAYPDVVSREAISEAVDYKRSSRDAYIQRLKARQLVASFAHGVQASPLLFD